MTVRAQPSRTLTRRRGLVLVALAWGISMAAVSLGAFAGVEWAFALRLLITAVIYAPVAALLIGRGRSMLVAILAALSISSAGLALFLIANSAAEGRFEQVVPVVAFLARQPENAALAILPWLLVRTRGVRTIGVAAGASTLLLDLAIFGSRSIGLPLSPSVAAAPLLVAIGSPLGAGLVLVRQSLHSSERERHAMAWFGIGVTLLVLSYLRLVLPLSATLQTLGDAAFVLAQGLLPTAILAIALPGTAQRRGGPLFTGVVSVQSMAAAIALYLIVEAVALGAGVPAAAAGAVAAVALALGFAAVRTFVRERTGQMYFGTSVAAGEVLRRLGERLPRSGAADDAVRALADSLRGTWQLSSVTITRRSDASPVRVGAPGAAAVSCDLVASGRTVGSVELTGPDETELRSAILPVLQEIAPLLAVAVLLAEVNQEVALTRARTLQVRGEERRMLHHELHDELAPSLAGIGYAMAAVRRLIATGSPSAGNALAELRSQVAERTEDLRRLARTLLPAALDAGDLDGALNELGRRFSGAGARLSIESLGTDVLDSDLQMAVYGIVADVITRLRTEDGRSITVGVDPEESGVRIRVTVEPAPGSEGWAELLRSAGRRAADVGGTVRSGSPSRAGRMEAVLPR